MVVGFLVSSLRQGKVGVGYAALTAVDAAPVETSDLTVADIDRLADDLAATSGPGSKARRHELLTEVFARATPDEQSFIRRLFVGEMRQGALDGVMIEAVAAAAEVPAAKVRRAHLLRGDLREVAEAAIAGGEEALDAFRLEVFRPLQPMLAKTAESMADALEAMGTAAIEWKLDGARLQVHKRGDEVRLYSRSLKEWTGRAPEVVEIVRSFPSDELVLDGEMIVLHDGGKPFPFQETMGRFGTTSEDARTHRLTPFFFDVLSDGADVLDLDGIARNEVLERVVPDAYRIPRIVTADLDEAEAFSDAALAAGHEGVMIKSLESTYAAGRRGAAWLKLKPAHTLDLVVLAAEWGHGRRTGWLSNLHLGARDPATGEFVMLGKTFKGLTDELLTWQTEALQKLATDAGDWIVHVRPELVVEIAIDGVQASTRYPGGMALRFARVKGYRPDKSADDADTIDAVRAIFER